MKRILLLFAVVIVTGVAVGRAQLIRTDAKPAPQAAKEVRGALPEEGSMPAQTTISISSRISTTLARRGSSQKGISLRFAPSHPRPQARRDTRAHAREARLIRKKPRHGISGSDQIAPGSISSQRGEAGVRRFQARTSGRSSCRHSRSIGSTLSMTGASFFVAGRKLQ